MKIECSPQEAAALIVALRGRLGGALSFDEFKAMYRRVQTADMKEVRKLVSEHAIPWVADAKAIRDTLEELLESKEQT